MPALPALGYLDDSLDTLRLINDQLLGIWDIYIKFYTAFIAFNLTALGVVVAKLRDIAGKKIMCVAFIAQNALCLATALGMAWYSFSVAGAFETNQEVKILAASRPLATWGGIANAIGNLLFISLWLVIFRGTQAPDAAAIVRSPGSSHASAQRSYAVAPLPQFPEGSDISTSRTDSSPAPKV